MSFRASWPGVRRCRTASSRHARTAHRGSDAAWHPPAPGTHLPPPQDRQVSACLSSGAVSRLASRRHGPAWEPHPGTPQLSRPTPERASARPDRDRHRVRGQQHRPNRQRSNRQRSPTVSAPTVSAPTVRARTGVAGLAVQDSLPRLDVAPAATHARVAADVVGPGGLPSVPPDPALDASRRTHGSGSGRLTSSVCARRDTSARVAPPGWAPSACDWPWRRMCRRPQRLWRSALLNETLRSDEHPMCVTFPRAGLLASAGSTVMTQVTVPLLPGARRVHPRGTVYR